MVPLEHRSGIDITFLRASESGQPRVERAQPRDDNIMVIVVPRVPGDASGRTPVGRSGRAFAGKIIHREHEHAAASGQDDPRVGAAFRIAFHPCHVAMASVAQPREKTVGMRRAGGPGDAAIIEPAGHGQGFDLAGEGGGFHGGMVAEALTAPRG